MKAKQFILTTVQRKGSVTSSDVVRALGISRQAAARHLSGLVAARKLCKAGSTRLARYIPYSSFRTNPRSAAKTFSSKYGLRGLEEDVVFREIELRMGLPRALSSQALRAITFAFTEMMNNAIDHSKGRFAHARCFFEGALFCFEIRDNGIGVFESIRRKFGFKDLFGAVEHLLKGKQTTAPEKHSGQGIFFTSKIADEFVLESAQQKLVVDNRVRDVFLKKIPFLKGTLVRFKMKARARKDLKALFDAYSNSDLEFDKTHITVHLSERKGEHVSRSQARRLLFGLDKFQRVVLDFKKVQGVGQGFADEVFRVFREQHPTILVEPLNMNESVRFMVGRAVKEATVKEKS
jgi:anti-sigma regulatory factor (Ser/Thr protein kinase)